MNFSRLLHSLKSLVVAPTCPVCGKRLEQSDSFVCLACNLSAPYTHLWQSHDNAMEQRFWGIIPIERAAAFMWYVEGSKWRDIIHEFKYHNHWFLAQNMGQWFATELLRTDFFQGIDLIVPVPLHWRRRLVRGYNQTEYIALGLSRKTGIKCYRNAVKRTVNNPPQAGMEFINRWQHIENIFTTSHPERLKGKHILLVDDVFTSGATLSTLAQSIIKACDGDVKISVATLAASRHLADK